jgi:23S rRNA pseudouridine1911/1915/1917 synthase
MELETLTISSEESRLRLDTLLAQRYPRFSRTYFQGLIDKGLVLLNGEPTKKRILSQEGDELEVQFTASPELSLEPQEIPLSILYEDPWIIAVNKAAGMVVHPGAGHSCHTFVNALLYHCKQLPASKELLRPGIVHRLDKDTSGVLIAAKTEEAQRILVEMFSQRKVTKEYLAICIGNPGSCVMDGPIKRSPRDRTRFTVCAEGGRAATTRCTTLHFDGKLSVVRLFIDTGRTHQIRVHLCDHRTPILGDPLYGSSFWNQKLSISRQLLHAHRLSLPHPITGELLEIRAPLPSDFDPFMRGVCEP